MKKLIVSDGKRERALVLVDRLIVGRDPACDVHHQDDLLSRRHAEFVAGSDSVTVRDLGSRNGVFVNGLRTIERPLYAGDVVQIGPLRILFAHDVESASILPDYAVTDRTVAAHRPAAPVPVLPPTPLPLSSTPTPPPPALYASPRPATDEDRTDVLTPVKPAAWPSAPAPPPQTTPSAASESSFQDGPTQFIPPPRPSVPASPKPGASPSPSATRITPAPAPAATHSPAPSGAPAAAAASSRSWMPPAASAAARPAPSLEPSPTVELTIDQTRIAPFRPAPRALDSDLRGYVSGLSTTIAIVALVPTIVPLSIVRADAIGAWLAIPLVVTMGTTYVVARAINRRFGRIVRALKPDGALGGDSFRESRGSSLDLFRS